MADQESTPSAATAAAAVTANSDPLLDILVLTHCGIEVRCGKYGNYFQLVNPNHPTKKLTLFKAAMEKLNLSLPMAFIKAKQMEQAGVQEGESQDIAVLQTKEKSEVILYVTMHGPVAFIYVRLFVEKDGIKQPCTYGVRLVEKDGVETIAEFVNKHKPEIKKTWK